MLKCVRLFAKCPVSRCLFTHVSYVQRFFWELMPEDLNYSVMETDNTSLPSSLFLPSSLPFPPGAAFAKIRCSSRENGECVVGCNSRSHGLCPCFTMADKALYELKKNLLMTFWVVSFLASINLNVNLAWMQSTLLMLIILSYKLKIIKYYKISGERYKKKCFCTSVAKKNNKNKICLLCLK